MTAALRAELAEARKDSARLRSGLEDTIAILRAGIDASTRYAEGLRVVIMEARKIVDWVAEGGGPSHKTASKVLAIIDAEISATPPTPLETELAAARNALAQLETGNAPQTDKSL